MSEQKEKKKKRPRRRKRDSAKDKLLILWLKNKSKFGPGDLLLLVRRVDYSKMQRLALEEFIRRPNLSFADFYKALALPEEILNLDLKLKEKIWKGCLDIATPDNLLELMTLGEPRAAKELFKRMDQRSMSMPKAKQILIWLLQRTTDEKLKKEYWRRLESIGPTEEELKYLLDLDQTSSWHGRIQTMLRKKSENKTRKTIANMEELVAQIKREAKTKQRQE